MAKKSGKGAKRGKKVGDLPAKGDKARSVKGGIILVGGRPSAIASSTLNRYALNRTYTP